MEYCTNINAVVGVATLKHKQRRNKGIGYDEYLPAIEEESNKTSPPAPINKWKLMRTVEKQSLTVSPNPSSTISTIIVQLKDVSLPTELKVTDVLGNTILRKQIVESYDRTFFSVEGLADGIYQCTVSQSAKYIMNCKLVVTHQ